MIYIQSERIIIRDLKEKDVDAFYKYRSDKELLKYQNFSTPSLDFAQSFIKEQKSIKIGQKDEWKQLAIALPDDTLIGDCAVQFTPEENRIAELGCTIMKDYHNKGYATAALKLLTTYIFKEFPIHKFKALVDIRNIASQKMLEKSGFQKEGHFIKHYWDENDHDWIDELQYGLLNTVK
ncbi:MAG: GNAT family N-acetyltransferase [Saprospiraceae bacterium]|nr:GNAT family N-acetyltransferase [Saprospiraceae bacterium]